MKVETRVVRQIVVEYSQEDLREQLLWQHRNKLGPLPADCTFDWSNGRLLASFDTEEVTAGTMVTPAAAVRESNGRRRRKRGGKRRGPEDLTEVQQDLLKVLDGRNLTDAQLQEELKLHSKDRETHVRQAAQVRSHRLRLQRWGYVQEVGTVAVNGRNVLCWGLTTRGRDALTADDKKSDLL